MNDKKTIHVTFMMGKARVAPLKKMTIPRMDLSAAVLATRMEKILQSELQLQLQSSTFWTDSQSVLKYIANEHAHLLSIGSPPLGRLQRCRNGDM